MLNPLQEQLREIIDSLTEGQTAALAGGGAFSQSHNASTSCGVQDSVT